MINKEEIPARVDRVALPVEGRRLVERILASEPARRVQGGRSNVRGYYPSDKVARTIQHESESLEYLRIQELEHDEDVQLYLDQPIQLTIRFRDVRGRMLPVSYTPDFFVLRAHDAGFEELKPEKELVKLAEQWPTRYVKGEDGVWHSPPVEELLAPTGLSFHILTEADVDRILARNWLLLDDYWRKTRVVTEEALRDILAAVTRDEGITLERLLPQLTVATVDDVLASIVSGDVFFDLRGSLLGDQHMAGLYSCEEAGRAYESTKPPLTARPPHSISVQQGEVVNWDGRAWTIVNLGDTKLSLLHQDGAVVEFTREQVDGLLRRCSSTCRVR